MLWLKVAMCAVVLILLSSMFVEEDAIRFDRCVCPTLNASELPFLPPPPPSPTQASRAPLLSVEPPQCQLEPAHFEAMKKDVARWVAFHARTPFTADSFVNARNADGYTYLFAIVNNSQSKGSEQQRLSRVRLVLFLFQLRVEAVGCDEHCIFHARNLKWCRTQRTRRAVLTWRFVTGTCAASATLRRRLRALCRPVLS
jgi:hypothetical protein